MVVEPTPQFIHQYQLVKRIEGGNMGEVWRALDTRLQRVVALKFLKPHHQLSADFVDRFEGEAQSVARMRHDNIVTLHDYYATDKPEYPQCYMVMSFIEGPTLQEYIRATSWRGQLPAVADIIYLFSSLALALDYAHAQGVVHRDIKPSNIILDQRQRLPGRAFGNPVLTDFGIARPVGSEMPNIEGTPFYIAPEQIEAHPEQKVDGLSDLYSLGIILYEVFTGVPPFQGDTPLSVMLQHLHKAPLPPEQINPQHVTPGLSAVTLKAIAKRPEERYHTCAEMVIALAHALKQPVPLELLPLNERPDRTMITALPPRQDEYVVLQRQAPPASELKPIPAAKRRSLLRSPLLPVGVVLFLLCIGSAIFLPSLLSKNNGQSGMVTAGQITFSQGGSGRDYTTIQIDLNNVAPAPAGKTYYAWIKPEGSEVQAANWPLHVKNGQIRSGPLTFIGMHNLLVPNCLFVVSLETNGGSPPPVPNQDLTQRFFFARIQDTNATTFTVLTCPDDPNSRTCL